MLLDSLIKSLLT